MDRHLRRLKCGVSNNDWGKLGKQSIVAQFAVTTSAVGDNALDENKPYAEFWMGAHPSLPSYDLSTGQPLQEVLRDNPHLLSTQVSQRFRTTLPFLFKVLSIREPLCIQAHPDRNLAYDLHARDPLTYPDSNHKPEMIVALTPFEALCGFRPLEEIVHFLSCVPPLRNLISDATAMEVQSACGSAGNGYDPKTAEIALKRAWSELLTAHPSQVRSCAEDLIRFATSRPSHESLAVEHGNVLDLILQLSQHYPHDVGLFAVLFMNHVCLSPGEALFVRSNELHAYLSGDGIECMASSANVVRAGFSRKHKDVDMLISMLTYENLPPFVIREPTPYLLVEMNSRESTSVLYTSPAEEFNIIKTFLAPQFATANFRAFRGPTVLICTQGSGKIGVGHYIELIECGHVFFAGAGAEIFIQSCSEEPLILFQSFCEIEEYKSPL
ncbi:mannose-6-phosphate isomerase [Aspergillus caelatus]|uniref:Mannose-6-phosphate isomerase n=1 Tax=Aspergillus caelatus TaxID=61420 RepID=A0A5N6ZX13_9EURO|nr:mannose-6-phosphate isomerase [Aspergillus caelatus]KAE8361935.1 mannose-6-phosphate isomerase [Aspergillus caelatus]